MFLGFLQGLPFIWLQKKGIGKQLGFWLKMVLFCPLISMTADSTHQFIIALASNGPMMSSSVYRTVHHHPVRRHLIALKINAVSRFSPTSSVFKLFSVRLSLCQIICRWWIWLKMHSLSRCGMCAIYSQTHFSLCVVMEIRALCFSSMIRNETSLLCDFLCHLCFAFNVN